MFDPRVSTDGQNAALPYLHIKTENLKNHSSSFCCGKQLFNWNLSLNHVFYVDLIYQLLYHPTEGRRLNQLWTSVKQPMPKAVYQIQLLLIILRVHKLWLM